MARKPIEPDRLRSLLNKQKIACLDELKRAIGTSSTMTVFRKLKALPYRSSYSHRGRHYTARDIPQFDERGLWSCRGVWFSQRGNLLETAGHFVEQSDAGLTASELEHLLHVQVKKSLLQLVRQDQIVREKISGVYVYLAQDKGQKRSQRLRRRDVQAAEGIGALPINKALSEELNAAIILFFSLLDERQRRLYAGLESQKLGYGGDRKIAELFGLDVHTVARGRRELFAGQVERGGVRKEGGGRKAVRKKRRRGSRRSPKSDTLV